MKISEKAAIYLEEKLNEITFNKIPLGGTIVSALSIEFINGNGNWSLKDRVMDYVHFFNLKYRGVFFLRKGKKKHTEYPDQYKNKGLLTFISSRDHLFKMNYFIWKSYEAEKLLCLVKNESIVSGFDDGQKPLFIIKNDLPSIDLKVWRQSFRKIRQPLFKIIKTFLKDNTLPTYVGWRILNLLMLQTQYLMAFEHLLQILQPRFVLVEHDRYSWCSCLILTAKKLGIPSFTMMHGVVNNQFGYMPLLADYLFCWGKHQKRLLEKYGGTPKRLIVTGAPQLAPSIKVSKQRIRKRLVIDEDKKVALLATNPVNSKNRYSLINIFCETVEQNKDIVGIVRLHPSEDIDFYSDCIKKYPTILFDKNNRVSYEESFALADIVCIFNSAYGMDAALKGLAVMLINVDNESLGQAKDFIDQGDFPVARSTAELMEKLTSYLNDAEYRYQVNTNIKIYTQQYCEAFGNEAADNMINFIKSKIELDD